jgi:GR25 family glycosyltransferase involved in LPS biosynthesis
VPAETAEALIFRDYDNAPAVASKDISRFMQNLLVKHDVYETGEPPVIQGIVINLEADRLKYQQMTTRLQQFGIPHKRFNAVSGKEIFENFKTQGKFENNGYALRAHQVGVWQSHYAIWKAMVEQKIDKLFIFEDDCSFVHDFDVMYHKTLELVRDKDYEILFVGYSGASIDAENELHLVDVGVPRCTHSYVLTRAGAQKLVERMAVIDYPIDETIGRMFYRKQLVGYRTSYLLVYQPWQKREDKYPLPSRYVKRFDGLV